MATPTTGNFNDRDENTHPPGTNEHWNESFYMNFFDAGDRWGGASRIGFSPNQGFAEGFLMLFFPDGATGFIRAWERCPDHLGRNSAGPFVHECLEPFKKWKLSYDGPIYYFKDPQVMGDFSRTMLHDLPTRHIKIDLEFNALHQVFDFHQSMRRELISMSEMLAKLRPGYFLGHLGPGLRKASLLRVMSGAQHYEHAGRISGVIEIGGEKRGFEGFGQRDHSWGVRDMRVPANWRWFSGQFGDEMCFNAIKVEVLAFRASGGYVYNRGKAEALADWTYRAEMDDETGRWAKNVTLCLVTSSGKVFEVRGEALSNIPVIVNTGGCVGVVNEAQAVFEWQDRTGMGVSEFMEQIT